MPNAGTVEEFGSEFFHDGIEEDIEGLDLLGQVEGSAGEHRESDLGRVGDVGSSGWPEDSGPFQQGGDGVQAQNGMSPSSDSGSCEELRPADLPISEDLARSLAAWAKHYDATFATEPDGFQTEAEALIFVERGRDFVGRLQDDLGEHWHVEYMPEPIKPPGLRLRRSR